MKCEVEREKEVLNISVNIAPRIQFKDGKAVKAWIGVGEIQAPTVVKGAIWSAAQLEDTFGVVHGDLIKEINRFVYERCPNHVEVALARDVRSAGATFTAPASAQSRGACRRRSAASRR